jgi:hypothetical protein
LPLSGFRVVVLFLVDSWQLTRGVTAHSNTSKDNVFMAVQVTRVEHAWRRSNDTLDRDARRLTKTGVAVEKLLLAKFAKIKSRQDALQSIFSVA